MISVPDLVASKLAVQDAATFEVSLIGRIGDSFFYHNRRYDVNTFTPSVFYANTDVPLYYELKAELYRGLSQDEWGVVEDIRPPKDPDLAPVQLPSFNPKNAPTNKVATTLYGCLIIGDAQTGQSYGQFSVPAASTVTGMTATALGSAPVGASLILQLTCNGVADVGRHVIVADGQSTAQYHLRP